MESMDALELTTIIVLFASQAYGFIGGRPLKVLQSEEMCVADTLIDELCDDSSEETRKIDPVRNAVLFVLKNKEIYKTSQIALNGLISDFTLLTEQTIDCQSSKVISVLERNGINYKDVDGLDEMLSDGRLCNPFFGLQSAHLYLQKFHRHDSDLRNSEFITIER